MDPTHLPMVPLLGGMDEADDKADDDDSDEDDNDDDEDDDDDNDAVVALDDSIVHLAVVVVVAVGRSSSMMRSTARVSSRNSSGSMRMDGTARSRALVAAAAVEVSVGSCEQNRQ